MQIRQLFRKGQVYTVPNLMTLFRILLIPFVILSYVGFHNTVLTIILLAVSALTDVMDGIIARKFHMISDLGKALDPLADKLTQVSVVLCLAFEHPLMWILLALCVIRETFMLIFGYLTMKRANRVFSARWYGKLSTVMLYGTSLALLVFKKIIPHWLTVVLIVLCMVCVVLAMVLYARFFTGVWKQTEAEENK